MNSNKLKEVTGIVEKLNYIESFLKEKPREGTYTLTFNDPRQIGGNKEQIKILKREIIEEAIISYGEKLEQNLSYLIQGD